MNNKDIFRFLDEEDIRKKLEESNYRFNSIEAAWLIKSCITVCSAERHDSRSEYDEEHGSQEWLRGNTSCY